MTENLGLPKKWSGSKRNWNGYQIHKKIIYKIFNQWNNDIQFDFYW